MPERIEAVLQLREYAETLGETAQYLPAPHLAFNVKDDVVSTDFAPLTR
jgi:hypothetical protein